MHGTNIGWRLLPACADLKREIVTSMLAWMDEGW
jgi:hypothetical protein